MSKTMRIGLLIICLVMSSITKADQDVTLQLKWFHSFQFAGYYMAKEQGFYQDAGLNVTIRPISPTITPVNAVTSGQADFGIADSSIVLHRLNDEPVVIASTIYQSSPFVFISLKEKNITSPYDFKDRRVMFQYHSDDAPLMALLALSGLENSDYTYVPHSFNDWALLDDETDVISAYMSDLPIKYRQRGHEVNIVDPSNYGIDFYGDLLFTSEHMAKQDPAMVKRFVAASQAGWRYALEHPEEAISAIQNRYSGESSREYYWQEYNIIRSLIRPKFVEIGTLYRGRFTRIAELYQDLGMADKNSNINGLFLSDYENTYQLKSEYWYALALFTLIAVVYGASQYIFSLRLKRLVNIKTQELEALNTTLQDNNVALSLANKKAKIAQQAKASFMAKVSHEVLTPVNGMYGILQVLRQKEEREPVQSMLDKALLSSQYLKGTISDILDLSQLDANQVHLEQVRFKFIDIANLVMAEFASHGDATLKFKIEKAEGFADGWIGDPARVTQVLHQLMSNAVKFTRTGYIKIIISTDDERLTFTVEDTGIGISDTDLPHLFDRFTQADESNTRANGGIGLGLAITHGLVAKMLGTIDVNSILGSGSRFTVSIPLPHEKPHDISDSEEQLVAPKLTDKKILIAEDNEINRLVIKSMLCQTGADIKFALNGREAVDYAQALSPDLVLMDIQMPQIDGIEACSHIRKTHPLMPIVALTSNMLPEDICKYEEVGFDDHIGKPVEIDKLFELVKRMLT